LSQLFRNCDEDCSKVGRYFFTLRKEGHDPWRAFKKAAEAKCVDSVLDVSPVKLRKRSGEGRTALLLSLRSRFAGGDWAPLTLVDKAIFERALTQLTRLKV
jgi:hypothetical protein